MQKWATPNSCDYGIEGIANARILLPMTSSVKEFLQRVFPDLAEPSPAEWVVRLDTTQLTFQHDAGAPHVDLEAACRLISAEERGFALTNVKVLKTAFGASTQMS